VKNNVRRRFVTVSCDCEVAVIGVRRIVRHAYDVSVTHTLSKSPVKPTIPVRFTSTCCNMYATLSFLTLLLPVSVLAAEETFSYDPDSSVGPDNWADLVIPNKTNQCGGRKQSGVDVPTGACDEMNANYKFTVRCIIFYRIVPLRSVLSLTLVIRTHRVWLQAGTCTADDLKFSIDDHVVQVTFDTTISNCTPPSMTIPNTDTVFDVAQYHIHAGADHALDGEHYGADMHIVHKNRNGTDFAVLGMFLEATNDEDTGLFNVMIAGLESIAEETAATCASGNSSDPVTTQGARRLHKERRVQDVYNPYLKLPAHYTTYYYSGSLTTPPCSEVVSWNVVDIPISLSVREFNTIINLILDYVDPETCEAASVASPAGYTARPVQPLNGRTITHKCPTGTESRFERVTAPQGESISAAAVTLTSYLLFASAIGALTGLLIL
jgi:carbonic anhydrase